jgi:hypothetical protein
VKQVYAVIAQSFRLHNDAWARGPAISGFLRHLRDHGLVEFEEDALGSIGTVTVLPHDLMAPPPPPPPPPVPAAPAPKQDPVGYTRERVRQIRQELDETRARRAAPPEDLPPGARPAVARLVEIGLTPEAAAGLSELLKPD